MALISELAARYDNEERPAGNLLDIDQIAAQLKAAARFYAGYAVLEAWLGVDPRPSDVTDSTPISLSEFAAVPAVSREGERHPAGGFARHGC